MFDQLDDTLQAAEDATAFADYERQKGGYCRTNKRPATPTERKLLAHLGYTVPADLTTTVTYRSGGVRTRTWPQLEEIS